MKNPVAQTANDPWVLLHNNCYYYCFAKDSSIYVSCSGELDGIAVSEPICVWTAPESGEYSKEIWAPELHFINGRFYIYFAADNGENKNHRMYAISCDSPAGNYIFNGKISDSSDKWAIDGSIIEINKKLYFIWSGWEGDTDVRQDIYIAEMSDPCTITGQRFLISSPEYDFELKGGSPKVNEGPEALIINGKVHIIYSASGSWCDDYCLGMLTLIGDNPLSKTCWQKSQKPVLCKSDSVFGPGHASFTKWKNKNYIIYHANTESGSGWRGRKLFIDEFSYDSSNDPVFNIPKV